MNIAMQCELMDKIKYGHIFFNTFASGDEG